MKWFGRLPSDPESSGRGAPQVAWRDGIRDGRRWIWRARRGRLGGVAFSTAAGIATRPGRPLTGEGSPPAQHALRDLRGSLLTHHLFVTLR